MGERGFHRPAMVTEVLAHLEPAGDGEIMDGTVGGGGHSRALLERYPRCTVVAVDRDPEALEAARSALAGYGDRVSFVEGRFDEAAEELAQRGPRLAAALLDLGVSTHQLDLNQRGFSFRPEAPLDMRMSGPNRAEPTAADLLNTLEEQELGRIFRNFGEERRWRALARAVVRRRKRQPFRVAADLTEVIAVSLRRSPSPKDKARIFQALRVAVNQELEALTTALPVLQTGLRPGGVMSVISYESLTDREVKRTFREWSQECTCPPGLPQCVCRGESLGELITRKVVRPSAQEASENPRVRSARLRSWKKAA